MKRMTFAVCAAALMIATPAWAQTMTGIFTAKGDRIVARQAKISFPKTIGALKLVSTGEFSHKGESIDNNAQYQGDNGIWATIYVYRPGYPDAALAAFETDRIMPNVYGAAVTRLSQTVVPFGGQPNSAIRITYNGAVRDGARLASASGFARVGAWIIKFRVSGPVERQADIETALDAFLAASKVDEKARLFPVGAPDFATPCPAAASGAVKLAESKDSMANALFSSLGASIANDDSKGDKNPLPPGFPANGLTKMCVRGPLVLGSGSMPILQPAGTTAPDTILVMLGDTGDLAMISKNLLDGNYTITKADMGRVITLGEIDRMPDNDELARLFSGKIPGALKIRSSTSFTVDGNSNVSIVADPAPAKK